MTLFNRAWHETKEARAVVFDLRWNRGGNSDYGAEILRHFTKRPLLSARWRSPMHIAVFRAWGKFADEHPPSKAYEAFANKDAWHEAEPDQFEPAADAVALPIAVVIGPATYSAGEDFVVMARSIDGTRLLGKPTAGSTAQSHFFMLPGDIPAQITARRDVFPDGTEFVGVGIKPDESVRITRRDIIDDADPVLDAALNYLRGRIR